jgi:hypothetical protein
MTIKNKTAGDFLKNARNTTLQMAVLLKPKPFWSDILRHFKRVVKGKISLRLFVIDVDFSPFPTERSSK